MLKSWGGVVAHEILVSAQGPSVLGFGVLGLRVWGLGLTINEAIFLFDMYANMTHDSWTEFAQNSFSQTMKEIIYCSTLLFPAKICSGGKIYHSKLYLFLTSQDIQMNLNLEKSTFPSMWMWLTSTLFRLKGHSRCHFEPTMVSCFLV